MTKKLTALLLALLCLAFAACGEVQEPLPPETDAPADLPAAKTLIFPGGFTGTEVLVADNDYRGGYLYRDRTGDGYTVVSNLCLVTEQAQDESISDYAARVIRETLEVEPQALAAVKDEDHSLRLGYDVYILAWEDSEGDARYAGDGFFFVTEHYTYLYCLSTMAEYREGMLPTWQEVFGRLELI